MGTDGIFLGAEDGDLGDALDGGDALGEEGIGVLVDIGEAKGGGGDGEEEDGGIGGVDFFVGGGIGHFGGEEACGGGDGGLDVLGGGIDVSIEVKNDGDIGDAEGTSGGNGIDACDGAELAFEGGGDGGGDGFGAGAWETGGDLDGGEIDIGEVADGELEEGEEAKAEEAEHDERGHDGATDEKFGEIHAVAGILGLAWGRVLGGWQGSFADNF